MTVTAKAWDATTSGGKVTTDFAVTGSTSATDPRLAGAVGRPAGTTLVIVTSNGDVRIAAAP